MASELSQVMELWLEESRKREVERREENERREQEWKEAEARQEEEWRRKEEEWRRTDGGTESSKVRGPNENISGYFSIARAPKKQN